MFYRLDTIYVDDMEAMPAMDQIQAALTASGLTAVMADTTQSRYIDIYNISAAVAAELELGEEGE